MASRLQTQLYTFPDASPRSIDTILNRPGDEYWSTILLRAGSGNSGTVTLLDSATGSAGAYLDASDGLAVDLDGFIRASEIFVAGSTSDTLYVTVTG